MRDVDIWFRMAVSCRSLIYVYIFTLKMTNLHLELAVVKRKIVENEWFWWILRWSDRLTGKNHVTFWQKWSKSHFLSFLAQKASKVIISLFSGFEDSSIKMRGVPGAKGGTQSWPGTAIVNHPLRQEWRCGLSYFPYIFYFVNFTISAAIWQGLFGSFENVILSVSKF